MSFLPYGRASTSGWVGAFGASAVLHGGAILGLMGLSAGAMTFEAVSTSASFTVTLDQLDPDTLAGQIEQDGLAGSDGNTPTDTVDPIATMDGEGAQPDSVEAASGQTIQLPLETPTQVQPETLTAQPADPEVIVPSPIMSDTVLPLNAATALDPVMGTDAIAPVNTTTAMRPNFDASGTITTNLTQPDGATSAPSPPPAAPSEQDLAIADLIERIRATPPQTCLIALPRRDGSDGVGLALIAAQDTAMEEFAQSVLGAQDTDIRQTRTLVDSRQCPAIRFVNDNSAYPAMRLGIQIDSPEVASGETITGVLRGVAGRYLTLVLVDDNGVVTNLQRFTTHAGNIARFDVPVTRVGLGRDTSPVILAIATDRPIGALTDRMGRLAQDVFLEAVTGRLDDAYLGLVTVDIR